MVVKRIVKNDTKKCMVKQINNVAGNWDLTSKEQRLNTYKEMMWINLRCQILGGSRSC